VAGVARSHPWTQHLQKNTATQIAASVSPFIYKPKRNPLLLTSSEANERGKSKTQQVFFSAKAVFFQVYLLGLLFHLSVEYSGGVVIFGRIFLWGQPNGYCKFLGLII
jgi:hypothetical protein